MNNETLEALEIAQDKIQKAVEAVEELKDIMQIDESEITQDYVGQLESYTIPHLNSWIDDENQPGSLGRILREIEKEEEHQEKGKE